MSVEDVLGSGRLLLRRDTVASAAPIQRGERATIEYKVYAATEKPTASRELPPVGDCLGGGVRQLEVGRGQAVQGLDMALSAVTEGTTATVYMDSELAYGRLGFTPSEGTPQETVPPDTDLIYEFTVTSVAAVKDVFDMTTEEKLEEAESLRQRGNDAFRRQDFFQAETQYRAAARMCDKVLSLDVSETKTADDTKEPILVNLGLALFKQGQFRSCVAELTKALAIRGDNPKSLYRRGVAHDAMGALDEAIADLKAAKALSPTDGAVHRALAAAVAKRKEATERQRKAYAAAFQESSSPAAGTLYDDKPDPPSAKPSMLYSLASTAWYVSTLPWRLCFKACTCCCRQ